jgi:hypothetical protein
MSTDMPLPSLSKPFQWMTPSRRAVDHAREIADVGDRWFLSVTGGVVGIGGWARREAWIVADSAVAAFATTVNVAKKLAAAEGTGPSPRRPAAPDVDESAPPPPRPGDTLDLLCAIRETEGPPEPGLRCAEPNAPNPAGVVPLLQALGRTVARHTPRYASLQEDPRFWTLIHLLQRLGEPAIVPTREAAGDPPLSERDLLTAGDP